jgi:hypothetical protein
VKAKWEQLLTYSTLARAEMLKQLSDLSAAKVADVLRIEVKELQGLAKSAVGWSNVSLQVHIQDAKATLTRIRTFVEAEGAARTTSIGEIMNALAARGDQVEALMDDPKKWFTCSSQFKQAT